MRNGETWRIVSRVAAVWRPLVPLPCVTYYYLPASRSLLVTICSCFGSSSPVVHHCLRGTAVCSHSRVRRGTLSFRPLGRGFALCDEARHVLHWSGMCRFQSFQFSSHFCNGAARTVAPTAAVEFDITCLLGSFPLIKFMTHTQWI